MKKGSKNLEEIWQQVPPDYYQKGVRNNLFQWIWHTWKWHSMEKFFKDGIICPRKILMNSDVEFIELQDKIALDNVNTKEEYAKVLSHFKK